uniref:DUF5801 repeats-in-toxin domain-containing protein n=1 Tax=Sphingomicrobium astaxanthinifaciens TaxID=1227949 RepID=UPI00223FF5D7
MATIAIKKKLDGVTDETSTIDESAGLQNIDLVGGDAGDLDDNDYEKGTAPEGTTLASLSLLGTMYDDANEFWNRLYDVIANGGLELDEEFGDLNGVAKSVEDFITFTPGPDEVLSGLSFVDGDGGAFRKYDGALTDFSAGADADGIEPTILDFKTLDGDDIYLFVDSDAGLGGLVLYGLTAPANPGDEPNIVFALYLQHNDDMSSARVWTVMFEPLFHPDGTQVDEALDLDDFLGVSVSSSVTFGFDYLPSGQNLFGIVGDEASAVVVIGKNPIPTNTGFTNQSDTINTSQGGGNVTIGVNNQMFDPGEGAFFTFVEGANPDFTASPDNGLDQNEADLEANIQFTDYKDVDGGHLLISQTQGNKKVTLSIAAYNHPINDAPAPIDFIDELGGKLGSSAVPVPITGITVIRNNVDITASLTITIDAAGVATIAGLQAKDRVEWTTGALVHDQVLVSNGVGKFDIGGIGVNEPLSASLDIGAQMRFEDDAPSASLAVKEKVYIEVDESLGQNVPPEDETPPSLGKVTVAKGDLFDETLSGGTDGLNAGATAYSLTISAVAADSGLNAWNGADGSYQSVYLYVSGDPLATEGVSVVGRVGTGGAADPAGAIAFIVSIDAATGAVSLDQRIAMQHDDPTDPDEADASALSLDPGTLFAKVSIEDNDMDPDSDSADLGVALRFEDDGPSVSLALKDGRVLIDESPDANAGENEAIGLGQISVAGAQLFDISGSSAGQDGEKSAGFGLELPAGAGSDSGLVDTASGQGVYLYMNDPLAPDDIVGRVGAAGAPDADGAIAFRIAIDSADGDVTLTQYRALVHDDATDPDESSDPLAIMAGRVDAKYRIVDRDDDADAKTVDLGPKLQFEDDGPFVSLSLEDEVVLVDESLGENADEDETASLGSVTVAGAILFDISGSDAGEDGEKSAAFSLVLTAGPAADSGLVDTASGQTVYLYMNDPLAPDDIVGRVGAAGAPDADGAIAFRIAIDSADGDVTLTQYRALVHDDATDPDESADPLAIMAGRVEAQYKIVDGDDDSDAKTVDLGPALQFEDDGPVAALALEDDVVVLVDESPDANGGDETEPAGTLGQITVLGSLLFDTTGSAAGQDGEKSAGFGFKLPAGAGSSSGLTDTATNETVYLYFQGDDVVGRVGAAGAPDEDGAIAFRVAIDSDDGDVTLTQYRALVHPDITDPDESANPLSIMAGRLLVEYEVIDGDDDRDAKTVDLGPRVQFEDDGPSPALSLKGGIVLVDETLGENPDEDETATFGKSATLVTDLFNFDDDNFGSDGAGSSVWTLELDPLGTGISGLKDSLTGDDVMLENMSPTKVRGFIMIEGVKTTVFTVEIIPGTLADPGDKVALDILRAVVHPDANDPDEPWDPDPIDNKAATLANGELFAKLTTSDKEGDSKSEKVDIGGILFFEDDAPTVNLALEDAVVLVDESLGENVPPEDETASLGSVTVTGAILFDTSGSGAGNDGEKSYAFSLKLTANAGSSSGLKDTASDQLVYLYFDGDDVVGRVGAGGNPDENGAIAFRVAIDSDDGDVTLTQYRALYHQDPDDPDENGSAGSQAPLAVMNGRIEAKLEIIDNDDDAAEQSVDLGPRLQFEDDGPTIGPVDDGQIDFETGSSVSKSLGGDVGEDPNA